MTVLKKLIPFALAPEALVLAAGFAEAVRAPTGRATPQALKSISSPRLPLSFEVNQGQADSDTRFLARTTGCSTSFNDQGADLRLSTHSTSTGAVRRAAVGIRLVGSRPNVTPVGSRPLAGKVNYFLGNDPSKWRRGVPTFGQVRYDGVYPGIDLVYHGEQGRLEYDFVVAPGADPTGINVAFTGCQSARIDSKTGDLLLATDGGDLRQERPVAYQLSEGVRSEVSSTVEPSSPYFR